MNQNFEVSSDLPLIVSYLENLDGIVDYLANRSVNDYKIVLLFLGNRN
jgi:hypothetical protein